MIDETSLFQTCPKLFYTLSFSTANAECVFTTANLSRRLSICHTLVTLVLCRNNVIYCELMMAS